MQGYKDARIQACKDTRMQGYKDTRMQGYKGTRIQGCKDKSPTACLIIHDSIIDADTRLNSLLRLSCILGSVQMHTCKDSSFITLAKEQLERERKREREER